MFEGSGTLDLTGLTSDGAGTSTSSAINPSVASVTLGTTEQADIQFYSGVTGPASIGSGLLAFASSGSGDRLTVIGVSGSLAVFDGYTSGGSLAATATFEDASFASLGLLEGTYVWTWGSGANLDSYTLQIGSPSAVPEPSSLALIGIGGLGMALMRRRRKGKAA